MARQARSQRKAKPRHRAKKRQSVVIPPAKEGQGRDARKAARRAALKAERISLQMEAEGYAAESERQAEITGGVPYPFEEETDGPRG